MTGVALDGFSPRARVRSMAAAWAAEWAAALQSAFARRRARAAAAFAPVLALALALALASPAAAQRGAKSKSDFIIGADISFTQAAEDRGMKYSVDGVRKDFIRILKDHGFNWIRLRLFNDPTQPGGYSRDGYCDLPHTIVMAKRAKAAGMKFLLDFHYSDNWADPDKQWEPSAWKGLHGAALEKAIHDYSRDVIRRLKAAGAEPDMVQVGNEIITGMVWPDGRVNEGGDWTVFGNLLKAAIAGVHEVDPKLPIMLHLALGGENHKSRNFIDRVLAQGVKFDVIGESYYPQWHGTIGDLRANLTDLATRYTQKIVVAEYPPTAPNARQINDVVRSLPGGKGLGAFVWEGGFLFDRSGAARPQIDVFARLAADLAAGKPVPPVSELGAPTGPKATSFGPIAGIDASQLEAGAVATSPGGRRANGAPEAEAGNAAPGAGADNAAPGARPAKAAPNAGADRTTPNARNPQVAAAARAARSATGASPFAAIAARHFNWVRLSLFNRAQGDSAHSWGDLPHTLALAREAKAAGLRILLDVELSDAPATPEQQAKPAAWLRTTGSGLERTIFAYTQEAVAKLKAQGTPPDMVQIGDEITSGILRPDGAIGQSWSPFGGLVRVASAGARQADSSARIMLELATAGDNVRTRQFLDHVIAQDVQFDAIAFRYDPRRDGSLDAVQANLRDVALRYQRPVAVTTTDTAVVEKLDAFLRRLPDGLGLGTFLLPAPRPFRWRFRGGFRFPRGDTTVYGPFGTRGISLQPFSMQRDAPSSLVDLSFLHPGPAGKNGFVRAQGGHLVDGKGNRMRFWGFNLTEWSPGSWEVPSKDDAAAYADQLSRFGVNFVRLHFLDLPAPRGMIDGKRDDSQHFDARQLDNEDYFIAQLIRRGIYVDLNLYVGRQFKPGDGLPSTRVGKDVLFFDRRTIELEKDYARQLLTHVNPYLGRSYADEPGVALVELVNEAAVGPGSSTTGPYAGELTGLYNAWLRKKLSPAKLDSLRALTHVAARQPIPRLDYRSLRDAPRERYYAEAAFFRDLQGGFFSDMAAYLRDSVGVKVPILGTADHAHAGSGYPVVQSESRLGIVDGHTYWQHPGERNVKNAPMVNDPFNSTVVELSRSAVLGMPYTVSEVNHPFPNQYAAEGIPILASYAGFQDWDAVVWYSFERKEDPDWRPYVPDPFDMSLDPVKMPEIAAGALMFERGDLEPARETVVRTYTQRQVDDSRFLPGSDRPYFTPGFPLQIPLLHGTRIGSFTGPATRTFSADASDPYRSDTGQLAWYHGGAHGLVTIDAPRTQALIGYVKANGKSVTNLTAHVKNDFCAIVLSSMDDRPIANADRLLLTAGVRVENTGMTWDARRTHTAQQGHAPELIEPVEGSITLRGLQGAKRVTATALDGAGRPIGSPIVARRSGRDWTIPVGEPVTTWYLVTVRR